jgi:hypothetical protein
MNITLNASPPSFEVRFVSLYTPGRGYVFPCDGHGFVDLDRLSEQARAMVGRELATPRICPHGAAAAIQRH